MTLSEMRAALKTRLESVSGIGKVYDYYRLVVHDREVRSDLVPAGTSKLHAWFLTLADDDAFTEVRRPGNCSRVTGRWWMHGFYALDEAGASEKDFETVLQAIITAFRAQPHLTSATIDSGPLRIKESGYRKLSGVLCHYAQLEIEVVGQAT